MAFDQGLADRVADLLRELGERGTRQKNVFGGRGFLHGRSTFLVVWDDGLLVKLTKDDYPVALALSGVTPFAPDGEKSMSTWVVVPGEALAEDPELRDWIRRGLAALPR